MELHAEEIVIEDLRNQLQSLPPMRNSVDFSNAFTCFEPKEFFLRTGKCSVFCEYGLCTEKCPYSEIVTSKIQAEDCGQDPISIFTSLGQPIPVTSLDYTNSSNSIALSLIKSVQLFYDGIQKIEVESVLYPFPKKLIEDGQMKSIHLTVINVLLYPDKTKVDHITVAVGLDLQQSGFNQLMCIGTHGVCETNQDYFLKRKGLVNAVQ